MVYNRVDSLDYHYTLLTLAYDSPDSSTPGIKLTREAHHVGHLPWETDQQAIDSYAGHFPIRQWKNAKGESGEASM